MAFEVKDPKPKRPIRFAPKTANFMHFILRNDCARPWYVYVESFIPAFIELVFFLSILDPEDILRMMGENLASTGTRTLRGKGKKYKRVTLGGGEVATERYAAKGLKTLLIITAPLEVIGFAWLCYASADHFFYRWQQLIELAGPCGRPFTDGPLIRFHPGGYISSPGGGPDLPFEVVQADRAGWGGGTYGGSLPIGEYQFYVAYKWFHPAGGQTTYRLEVIVGGGIGSGVFASDPITADPGTQSEDVLTFRVLFPFLTGGTYYVRLVGPGVPIGLNTGTGRLIIERTA